MTRVLVTHRLTTDPVTGEIRDCLDVRWASFLVAAGLVGVPVPSGVQPDRFLDAVGGAEGVVLTGGNSISSVSSDPLSRARDAFETALCDIADQRKLPVVGVCRGAQFLAQRYGMRVVPSPGHVRIRHDVHPDPATLWLAGRSVVEANSFHDFAPDGTARGGLRVAARAADGTVEAVEHESGAILGMMWHPERESPWCAADIDLFHRFFGPRSI